MQTTKNPYILSVRFPRELRRPLKVASALEQISINSYIIKVVRDCIFITLECFKDEPTILRNEINDHYETMQEDMKNE